MRSHWANCIVNFDTNVDAFVADYFSDASRRVLLIAAAGFDPRSRRVTEMLSAALGDRLSAIFIREDRPGPSAALVERANKNEEVLKKLVPDSTTVWVEIFADDGAPVGGARVVSHLEKYVVPEGVTDVVLDFSALSLGISFPAAKMLLEDCEAATDRAFHLMIVSNPELDDKIACVHSSRPSMAKGFAPPAEDENLDVAQVWIPQLAHGGAASLNQIGITVGRCYKICPLLPFPARNPRRADDLITEYGVALREWDVDPRDVLYGSERNPLDCYRTLSMLKSRFDRTMMGTYNPRAVLSPIGSKVLAAGALMAAIEHEMAVCYLEVESYDLDDAQDGGAGLPDMAVHLVLSGPLYDSYEKAVV